ncbi:TPA: hypothetical protein SI370_000442 [Escherichia coli]|nr:hypothetical protein [Escherichia coli]
MFSKLAQSSLKAMF